MAKMLANLTTEDVAALDSEQTVVMFPIAAMEQHGPHLPIGTDTLILQAILDRTLELIDEETPLLVTPVIPVGKSNEHMPFPGTLTFAYQTLMAVVTDICGSIARHGFNKVVIFNAHGGNTEILTSLSRDLRDKFNIKVFVIDWWFTNFWADILAELQESPRDGVFHACELETSIMMAAYPHLVKADRIAAGFPPEQLRRNNYVTIFGPVTMGWLTPDITPSGVIGDPTKATPEKGKAFIEFGARKLIEIIKEIRAL